MTLLLTFLAAMICVSGSLFVAARLFLAVDARAEQWPLFWATGLGLSLLIPLCGLLLLILPDWVPTPEFDLLSLHQPLQSLGFSSGPELSTVEGGSVVTAANAAIVLLAIYGLGFVFNLAKLWRGRARIQAVLKGAEPLGPWCEDDVLLSDSAHSPFAWTPFGRPQYSRIVMPQSYCDHMSRESLTDILIHEREHIARRDDECGLILRLILCVCWVSPFAHALFERWSQSTEIQCDMAVTVNRDPTMRKTYADTLLQAIHIMAGRVRQYPAASFSTHRIRNEKMRITHIIKGTRPAYKRRRDRLGLALAASTLTALGMISISATATATDKGPEPIKVTETAAPTKVVKSAAVLIPTVNAIVTGRLTSSFGLAPDPFAKGKMRDHFGVDIAAPTGTPIYAPADGVIKAATNAYRGNTKYGNVVALQTAGGVLTMFAHLDGYTVTKGQRVTKGTQIATVGSTGKSTGPHVHIETYQDGTRVDPVGVWSIVTD